MDTDLDRDDPIGHRMRALQGWQPTSAREAAWQRVERRRRRDRYRHGLLGSGALIFATATIAVFVNLSLSNTPRHVNVVGAPAATDWRPVAPIGAIKVTTPGPYRPGQNVTVTITPTSRFRAEDPGNQPLDFCYRWSRGENCDPAIRSTYVDTNAKGVVRFTMRLPGWVYTPTGRRACRDVHCRVEYENTPGHKIGSKVLDINSGSQPKLPARITSIGKDARIGVHLDSIRPDPSWTRWAKTAGPNARKILAPGDFSICAFTDRLECDALVRPPAPAFDGKPHETVVRTNRLLLTRPDWRDCKHVQCAIVISRNIGVTGFGGGVGSDSEIIALLPYRLPGDAAVMPRPTLTIASHPPVHVGDTLTVTLHDPPPNVDPAHRLFLAQCSTTDVRLRNDCGIRFDDVDGQTQAWTKLPDGSLRQRWKVFRCNDPSGCFLAIDPPAKGWPAVARTPRFAVKP